MDNQLVINERPAIAKMAVLACPNIPPKSTIQECLDCSQNFYHGGKCDKFAFAFHLIHNCGIEVEVNDNE